MDRSSSRTQSNSTNLSTGIRLAHYMLRIAATPKSSQELQALKSVDPYVWDQIPGDDDYAKHLYLVRAIASQVDARDPNAAASLLFGMQYSPRDGFNGPFVRRIWEAYARWRRMILEDKTITFNKSNAGGGKKADYWLRVYRNEPWRMLKDVAQELERRNSLPNADLSLVADPAQSIYELGGGNVSLDRLNAFYDTSSDTPEIIALKKEFVNIFRRMQKRKMRRTYRRLASRIKNDKDLKEMGVTLSLRTLSQILRNMKPTEIDGGEYIKLVGEEIAARFYTLVAQQGAAKLSQGNGKGLSANKDGSEKTSIYWIFSQDNPIIGKGQPIGSLEVLNELGIGPKQFPIHPSDELDLIPITDAMSDEEFEAAYKENIARALPILERCMLDGGYMAHKNEETGKWEGGGLEKFNDSRLSDFDGPAGGFSSYLDHTIYYIYSSVCGRSMERMFDDLISKIDPNYPKELVYRSTKILSDDVPFYKDIGMVWRSNMEREVARKFRNTFKLTVVPYDMGLPVPDGCATNQSEFLIDFVITAPVLKGYVTGQDGRPHPQVDPNVTFVGEYFGMNSPKPCKLTADITAPDGSVLYFDKKNQVARQEDTTMGEGVYQRNVQQRSLIPQGAEGAQAMTKGSTVPYGAVYAARTEWKRMTETFTSAAIGCKTIFIDKKIDDHLLMEQLDNANILYTYNGSLDKRYTRAARELVYHRTSGQCRDYNCDSRTYLSPSASGTTERAQPELLWIRDDTAEMAYVRAAIAHIKIEFGVKEALREAYGRQFTTKAMHDFFQAHERLLEEQRHAYHEYQVAYFRQENEDVLADKWAEYLAVSQDVQQLLAARCGDFVESYQKIAEESHELNRRIKYLNELLEYLDKGNQLPAEQIKLMVQLYTQPLGKKGVSADESGKAMGRVVFQRVRKRRDNIPAPAAPELVGAAV